MHSSLSIIAHSFALKFYWAEFLNIVYNNEVYSFATIECIPSDAFVLHTDMQILIIILILVAEQQELRSCYSFLHNVTLIELFRQICCKMNIYMYFIIFL